MAYYMTFVNVETLLNHYGISETLQIRGAGGFDISGFL